MEISFGSVPTSTKMLMLLQFLVILIMASASSRPHIILIVADDLGWNDVSMHGADQIPTPNIDALAFSGILLRRHYVLPACTPSRTALLTGLYPIRTGMQGYPLMAGEPRALTLDVPLLPQHLKELGYTTRMIGKWHIGCMKAKYTPTQRGFDSHYGYWNGYVGYFDHCMETPVNGSQEFYGHDFWNDMAPNWEDQGQYATSLFTQEAQRIITEHNKSQPLFLYVAHLAVHTGAHGKIEVPSEEQAHSRFAYIRHPQRRLYAETVKTLDDSVGKIVSSLRKSSMLNNSIIVFMSDNGGVTTGLHTNTGSNWPFRGIKLTLFEGAVRGVAAVWSPLIEKRGRVMPHLMHITDWLPTLYRAAGGDPAMLQPMDGVDQWKQLSGESDDPVRSEVLLNMDMVQNNSAIIHRYWKLVEGSYENGELEEHFGDSGRDKNFPVYDTARIVQAASIMGIGQLTEERVLKLRRDMAVNCGTLNNTLGCPPCPDYCLFDLRTDPCENENVANRHLDVVHQLKARLLHFREQLVPELNRPVDVRSDPTLFNNTWVPWLDYVENGQNLNAVPSLAFLFSMFICSVLPR